MSHYPSDTPRDCSVNKVFFHIMLGIVFGTRLHEGEKSINGKLTLILALSLRTVFSRSPSGGASLSLILGLEVNPFTSRFIFRTARGGGIACPQFKDPIRTELCKWYFLVCDIRGVCYCCMRVPSEA